LHWSPPIQSEQDLSSAAELLSSWRPQQRNTFVFVGRLQDKACTEVVEQFASLDQLQRWTFTRSQQAHAVLGSSCCNSAERGQLLAIEVGQFTDNHHKIRLTGRISSNAATEFCNDVLNRRQSIRSPSRIHYVDELMREAPEFDWQ
jgi:hypothetical protein